MALNVGVCIAVSFGTQALEEIIDFRVAVVLSSAVLAIWLFLVFTPLWRRAGAAVAKSRG
jgi:hypothetical protein